jgi:N-acetylglucosamine-6-phosphate deacetylase
MGHAGSASLMIAAQRIFDGIDMRGRGSVRISQGRIESVSFDEAAGASIRLPADAILAPGFIDIQVNGGGGVLLNDHPTEAGVRRIVEAMIETLRNAVAFIGISLVDALIMASRTPAAFLGLGSELGRIAPGYRADLVAFNPSFEVVGTWIGGIGWTGEASKTSERG